MANPFTQTSDIITYFESIVDDSLDSVTELTLAEQAKNEIEDEQAWEILKKLDTSKTFASGNNYLTTFALPTDFREPIDTGIFVGTQSLIPFLQIPFEDLYRIQDNISYRYIIDFANGLYHILGKPQSDVIYFWYKKTTPTLSTAGGNPVWPVRFWPLIAMRMAMIFYGIDQGQKAVAWDDRWERDYNRLYSSMKTWNQKLINIANQNRQRYQQAGPLVLDM